MVPTVRIDDEVYAWLQGQARPFEDTPNSVLRRVAGLPKVSEVERKRAKDFVRNKGRKTRQTDFRPEILKVLARNGGELQRKDALSKLETTMKKKLTSFDKEEIRSGTIRWQKSAEWEVRAMREEGLLKPVNETTRGVWALTNYGNEKASELLGDSDLFNDES